MSSENTKAKWIAIAVVGAIIGVIALTSKADAQVTPQSVWRLLGSSISTNVNTWKAGIGTTTPDSKLTVQGTAGATAAFNPFNIASSTGTSMLKVAYDGAVSIPGVLTVGSCSGCAGSIALDDLSDVVISAPAYGNVLAYTGANWAKMSTSTLFGQDLTVLGSPTFAGAALGTGSLTLTGSIAATGARVTKGWFTDVESSNMYTVGGTSLSSTFSPIAGSASIVTVGTITSGAWAGTTIPTNKGGTGTTTQQASKLFFGDGDSFEQSVNLHWDTTNSYLGISSSTPKRALSVGGAIVATECDLTDAATVTFNLATCNQGRVVLGGNRTIDFTNELQALGQTIRVIVCQDGTGSRTLAPDAAILWSGGTAPTLTTTANKCDVLAGFVTTATGTPKIFLGSTLNF